MARVTLRSDEHLVATNSGVYKVETVMRRGDDETWSNELVEATNGDPKQPVPGSNSHKVITYSRNIEDEGLTGVR